MMAGQYQGGPSVDVLSTQGKKAESLYKSFGSVKKVAPPSSLKHFKLKPQPSTLPRPRPLPAPRPRHPAGGKRCLLNTSTAAESWEVGLHPFGGIQAKHSHRFANPPICLTGGCCRTLPGGNPGEINNGDTSFGGRVRLA